jgi:hypothetical protein
LKDRFNTGIASFNLHVCAQIDRGMQTLLNDAWLGALAQMPPSRAATFPDPLEELMRYLLIVAAVLLSGCAASVQRHGTSEERLMLSPAATKRVVLDVQGSREAAASKDWEQFRNEWRVGMGEAAKAAGMTLAPADVGRVSDPSTLVTVKINDYRYITRGARVAVGMMTGNAYIDADVMFAELPGRRPAGVRKFSTTSSAMQGAFSAMTESQIRGICDEIVKDVAQR